jgi:hypothetical protein
MVIEATNTNFIFLCLTRSQFIPKIYRTRGEHANHYATDAVPYFYFIFIICLIKFLIVLQYIIWKQKLIQNNKSYIRQVTFDRMVMILYRTYNYFSLFAMQLDYCNIQRVFEQK